MFTLTLVAILCIIVPILPGLIVVGGSGVVTIVVKTGVVSSGVVASDVTFGMVTRDIMVLRKKIQNKHL